MKDEKDSVLMFIGQMMKLQLTELQCWRARYPHTATFIAEEAKAIVENRQPKYPATVCIG